MGGRSGGGGGSTPGGAKKPRKGGLTGDIGNAKVTMVESLIHMKDPAMYKAVTQAIARYHSVLGVREQDIKLGKLGPLTMGVTQVVGGKNDGIILNSDYFKGANASKVHKAGMERQYKEGWQTKTNKPLAHVVTHELAHATWNSYLTAPNAVAAGKEVRKLYDTWRKDKKRQRKSYGDYAKSNINEFWAETCTKAVHGNADHYTRTAKSIIRRYKL